MIVDIKKAKQALKKYVEKYNPEDKKIKMKIEHIERVSQIAKQIATEQNLSEEDIELAELIGLLHDIGRFEQIRIYHTFKDKDSINHGEYGAKILFEEGYIKSFEEIKEENNQGVIRITLKYTEKGKKVIDGLKRISKPGLRVYASKTELPKVLNGLGIALISTSKGIMTDKKAREAGLGGEVIAYVW